MSEPAQLNFKCEVTANYKRGRKSPIEFVFRKSDGSEYVFRIKKATTIDDLLDFLESNQIPYYGDFPTLSPPLNRQEP